MRTYTDVVRMYESNKIRGGLWFLFMSLVAAAFGIWLDSAILAAIAGFTGLAIALLFWRHRLRVIRKDNPTDIRSSLWEIEYRGHRASIEESQIEELRVRHNLVRVSEDDLVSFGSNS